MAQRRQPLRSVTPNLIINYTNLNIKDDKLLRPWDERVNKGTCGMNHLHLSHLPHCTLWESCASAKKSFTTVPMWREEEEWMRKALFSVPSNKQGLCNVGVRVCMHKSVWERLLGWDGWMMTVVFKGILRLFLATNSCKCACVDVSARGGERQTERQTTAGRETAREKDRREMSCDSRFLILKCLSHSWCCKPLSRSFEDDGRWKWQAAPDSTRQTWFRAATSPPCIQKQCKEKM